MPHAHPIDAILRSETPRNPRVTAEMIKEKKGGSIDVTLIVVARPVLALDVTLHPKDEGVRLTSPRPLPVILAGAGLTPGGIAAPHVFGAGPCKCPPNLHGAPKWNPLSVAVVWSLELPPRLGAIAVRYLQSISAEPGVFCDWGLLQIMRTMGK